MDRFAAVVIATIAAATLAWTPAFAQELATLHVRDFALGVDRTSVRVGEPFHLTIVARLGEPIAELDNVTLPNLSGFEELGDERRCSATASSTECLETLTLDATQPGEQTIGAATLSAVDARTGRPSRFITGTVTLHVSASDANDSDVRTTLYRLAANVLRIALILLFLSVAAAALWWGWKRRELRAAAVPALVPEPAREPEAAPEAGYGALVERLAREPTREHVFAVRRELRSRAGAREHETLRDLIARRAFPDDATALALAAVERAAFCREPERAAAVREALPYLA
jgi:hypothetical protein